MAEQVLAFDTFGTVVDWHRSITREVASVLPELPAADFARDWRSRYHPSIRRVEDGTDDRRPLDAIHRSMLDDTLAAWSVDLPEESRTDLALAWRRLDPWPDAVPGLTRLRERYVVCPLSNGNTALLVAMAKRAGLPWDLVPGSDLLGHFKPHSQTYLGLARVLGVRPEQVRMVAAHQDDLAAARSFGLRTAFVERPLEFGAGHEVAVDPLPDDPEPPEHLHVRSLEQLADVLGC